MKELIILRSSEWDQILRSQKSGWLASREKYMHFGKVGETLCHRPTSILMISSLIQLILRIGTC